MEEELEALYLAAKKEVALLRSKLEATELRAQNDLEATANRAAALEQEKRELKSKLKDTEQQLQRSLVDFANRATPLEKENRYLKAQLDVATERLAIVRMEKDQSDAAMAALRHQADKARERATNEILSLTNEILSLGKELAEARAAQAVRVVNPDYACVSYACVETALQALGDVQEASKLAIYTLRTIRKGGQP